MIWATLDSDGNLLLTSSEGIEMYALEQWEINRKRGKAKIIIDRKERVDMQRLSAIVQADIVSWRKWQRLVDVGVEIDPSLKDDLKKVESGK